jgi:probable HAF family extracellular repeat protein
MRPEAKLCRCAAITLALVAVALHTGNLAAQTGYTITTFEAALPGYTTYITQVGAINSSGYVVGTLRRAYGYDSVAYVRNPDGSFHYFSPRQASRYDTFAYGISGAGTIAGSYYLTDTTVGFLQTAPGENVSYMVGGAESTVISSVNNAGYYTGWFIQSENPGSTGFLTSPKGTEMTFRISGSPGTFPYAINNYNVVAGYFSDSTTNAHHGFTLTQQGDMTQLDIPGAVQTWVRGLNDLGQVVGYYETATGPWTGFIYSNGEYTSFNVPGAASTFLAGINNSGQLVGDYNDASGVNHAFIATRTP